MDALDKIMGILGIIGIIIVLSLIVMFSFAEFEINQEALSETGDGFVACTGETCYICPEPASSEKCQEVKRRT